MADSSHFSPFDEYDLKARMVPALVGLTPLAALAIIWWPALWTVAGSLASAGLAVVLLVCLVFLAGSLGVGLETKWGDAVGTRHSARLLSHANNEISDEEKSRIHAFLAGYRHPVPSEAEERSVDERAQAARIVAVRWLITVSRPEAGRSLLLKENIVYGFWRNLCALKPAALTLALVVLAVDLYLLDRAGQADPRFPAGVGLAVLCIFIVLFLLLAVTRARVIDASRGYATRLFSLRDDAAVIARAAASLPPPPAGEARR